MLSPSLYTISEDNHILPVMNDPIEHDRNVCEACLQAEYEEFSHTCVHESIAKNEASNAEFRGFEMPRWDYSDQGHTLSFSENGKTRLICDVVIAGTTLGAEWQWSWGNKQTDAVNRDGMRPVLELGEAKQWTPITSLFRTADEYTGWECASVASHVLGGQANYRFAYGDNDEYFAYLVILRTHRVN